MWAAPIPCAIISGFATTSQAVTVGFARHASAILRTEMAISQSPSTASSLCASISRYGSVVTRATNPPYANGIGPYGAGVHSHIGSTALTIGPDSTPGPVAYGS